MKSISVFCGSSNGLKAIYSSKARELGQTLANEGIRVVYGGAKIGLMGKVAEGALDNDGEVFGVIPTFLQSKEIAHDALTKMFEVDTMHQRKTKMHELSDAIITLPGGFGTMEEFFEILTWGQLGLHTKPMGLLNIDGFYDPLIDQLDTMVRNELLKPVNRNMVMIDDDVTNLLVKMKSYQSPSVKKWITDQET